MASSALACPVGRYGAQGPKWNAVMKSWQETGRDTCFPFNLLVSHLHRIQILKMQFHQPINLKERCFTGVSEKGREYLGQENSGAPIHLTVAPHKGRAPLPLLTLDLSFALE